MSELKHSITEGSTMGEQLRFAREAKGLSQAEVSRALCLPVNIIDALERDKEDALPPRVFVKGYIKNYARLLKLPLFEDEFERVSNTTAFRAIAAPSTISETVQFIGQILLKGLNYFVILALIVLFFIWWHDKQRAAEKELSLANMSVQEAPFPKLKADVPPILHDTAFISAIRPWWPFDGEDNG